MWAFLCPLTRRDRVDSKAKLASNAVRDKKIKINFGTFVMSSSNSDLFMEYKFIHLSTLFTAWTTSQGKNGEYSLVVSI